MKSSCISHPASEPLIIVRRWQIQACGGNHCAAMLISFLEYWHNRLDGLRKGATVQKHTEPQLEAGLLGFYRRDAIRAAFAELEHLGFVRLHRAERMDRTRRVEFLPETVQAAADKHAGNPVHDQRKSGDDDDRKTGDGRAKFRFSLEREVPLENRERKPRAPAAAGSTGCGPLGTVMEGTHAIIRAYCAAFAASFGRAYIVQGAKDGAAAKRLAAASLTPEQVADIARRAWARPKSWNCQQASSLAGLASRWNQIGAELNGPLPAPVNADDPFGGGR